MLIILLNYLLVTETFIYRCTGALKFMTFVTTCATLTICVCPNTEREVMNSRAIGACYCKYVHNSLVYRNDCNLQKVTGTQKLQTTIQSW